MAGSENSGMYTEYFKLSEPPFSLTPDPRFLYMSERHREGLAHLFYGVQQPGGFVQLTGDVGSGKTTLCRCLVKQLPPGTDIALILNPRLTVIELLATVCDELGIPYLSESASVKILIDALNQRLLKSHAQNRRTVLIIDEAQNLDEDVLEQIRLLTNLETSKEKLLQIILIGQPELLPLLKRKNLRQLAQRITARYHLLSLSRRETYAYIQHRLMVAGRREPLFTRWAMYWVHRLSRGVPRVINIICDRALLGAYALDKQRIRAAIVRKASREAKGTFPWRKRFRYAWMTGLLIIAALIIAVAVNRGFLNPSELRQKMGVLGTGAEPPASTQTASPQSAGSSSAPLPLKYPENNQLAELLKESAAKSKRNDGFSSLCARMGIALPSNSPNPGCGDLRALGYDCLFQAGNWPKIRRYNLPAILGLVLPSGSRQQVTAVALSGDTVTLTSGKWTRDFSIWEVSRVWDGAFILVWHPPFPLRQLSIGDSGKEVLWLRRSLDALDGKNGNSADSDQFDEGLRQRILAFQRSQSLIQDGVVGNETLVRLTFALQGSAAPSLTQRNRS